MTTICGHYAFLFIFVLCVFIDVIVAQGGDADFLRPLSNISLDSFHLKDFERRLAGIRGISSEDEGSTRALFALNTVNFDKSIHLHHDGSYWDHSKFRSYNDEVCETKHMAQTVTERNDLQEKWSHKVLIGEVDVWELFKLLHFTVDHSDYTLFYTSQLIHSLQIYNAISSSQITDKSLKKDLQLAALLHDMGKLLCLVGNEIDSNVDCMNRIIPHTLPAGGPAIGLFNMSNQWNHDEYAFQKFHQASTNIPLRVMYAIRYHSLREIIGKPNGDPKGHHVNNHDVHHFQRHLSLLDLENQPFVVRFRHFDQSSKREVVDIPNVDWTEIKELLHEFVPNKIVW